MSTEQNTPSREKHGQPVTPAHEVAPFADFPRWLWRAFLSTWAVLFGLFVIFLANGGRAIFAVAIATLFLLMAFGLPVALTAQAKCGGPACGRVVQTRTGPLSIGAAAAQILLIPAAAVLGLLALVLVAL